MTYVQSTFSTQNSTEGAYQEVKRQVHPNPNLILFFTSMTYDFEQLVNLFTRDFPESQVVGVTTAGEVTPKGYNTNSLSVMSFDRSNKAKAVFLDDISNYPIFSRDHLVKAVQSIGTNRSLGLVFPTGLHGSEEKMLSIVNSVIPDSYPIFGGTAGDDIQFKATSVSLNEKVTTTGGVVVFLQPPEDFHITKENIFKSTNKKLKVTKADPEKRTVYELNGKKATEEYARLLGIPTNKLPEYFMSNPLGRPINNDIYIASPFQVNADGSIQFYCQVFEGAIVDILEPKNPAETLKDTLNNLNHVIKPEGVMAINCILRRLQFENERSTPSLNNQLSLLPNLCGFVSYGEQLDNTQLNQTLCLLAFGKKK